MSFVFYAPPGILRTVQHLEGFLDGRVTTCVAGASHVLGWGYRPSGQRAQRIARRRGLKCVFVEDGLLATTPGLASAFRLSLAVDTRAPYFDTSRPTDLEALLREGRGDAREGQTWLARWKAAGLSKYGRDQGRVPQAVVAAHEAGREVIVLLDQLAGDASLATALTGPAPFERMVQLVRARHPSALVVLKKHPRENARGGRWRKRRGSLKVHDAQALVCPGDVSMAQLAPYTSRVYTVTSQAGFEALLWGVPVTCVGHPWYAGWGLTEDLYRPQRRQALPQRSLLELFTVALGHYCRYAHPATGHRLTFSEALAHVELQQAVRRGTPRHVAVVDAQPWKKRIYRDFLPGATLTYLSQDEVGVEPVPGQCLVLWGQRVAQSRVDQWRAAGHRVWQCEDGFLRSVGLGCELARPLSLSFDETGLYADPRTNSDLLAAIRTPLDAQQTADARAFLRLHHDLRLSKYVGITQDEGVHWRTAHVLAGVERPVMLVCGQVADDISMRASGCPYTSYEHLIGALRVNRPEAFVIYRPHPDVVKGLRPGELTVHNADLNDTQSATRALAERAEEVHVINSLTGFEALMAGKKVVTWGRAWYAGWGLTHDAVQPARDVSATLEQLVHAAYLQRPRYFDHRSAQFVTASVAAELLARERASAHAAPGWVARVLAWVPRRITRRAARLYERVSERLSDARA